MRLYAEGVSQHSPGSRKRTPSGEGDGGVGEPLRPRPRFRLPGVRYATLGFDVERLRRKDLHASPRRRRCLPGLRHPHEFIPHPTPTLYHEWGGRKDDCGSVTGVVSMPMRKGGIPLDEAPFLDML